MNSERLIDDKRKPFPYDSFSLLKGFILAQNPPAEVIRCMDHVAKWAVMDDDILSQSKPQEPERDEDGNYIDKKLMPVWDADELSVRNMNILRNEDIKTLGRLAEFSESEMLRIPNFGRKSLNELRAILNKHGMSFKGYSSRAATGAQYRTEYYKCLVPSIKKLQRDGMTAAEIRPLCGQNEHGWTPSIPTIRSIMESKVYEDAI